jgi:hypothetical protein
MEDEVYRKYDPMIPVPDELVECMCPRCVNLNYRERVTGVLTNMPPEGYRELYTKMMQPLLRNFSEFNPALFPVEWVDAAPPEYMPVNPMRRIFHHMCSCLDAHRYVEGNEAEDVVFSIQSWSEELIAWLLRRRRKGGESGKVERKQLIRLAASTHELVGIDVVFKRLNFQIASFGRYEDPPLSVARMCDYVFDIGRPLYALYLARLFLTWYAKKGGHSRCCHHVRSYLQRLVDMIVSTRLQDVDRNVAVAMALHERLGCASGLNVLGPDILALCLDRRKESLVTWRDVMGEWIGESKRIDVGE